MPTRKAQMAQVKAPQPAVCLRDDGDSWELWDQLERRTVCDVHDCESGRKEAERRYRRPFSWIINYKGEAIGTAIERRNTP